VISGCVPWLNLSILNRSTIAGMSEDLLSKGIILHIWPGKWGLPSFEPLCLAAVLYFQLAIPGKFSIVETINTDSSPSGMRLSQFI